MGFIRRVSLFLILLTSTNISFAQNLYDGNGLEVSDSMGIFVLVEGLTNDAAEIGLYESRIKDKIELRLQQAGINIISKNEYIEGDYDYYLYANILVVGNAFNIKLEFKRTVYYTVDEKLYRKNAVSWDSGGSGTHGSNSEYIIDGLDRYMDSFINNFLKAN